MKQIYNLVFFVLIGCLAVAGCNSEPPATAINQTENPTEKIIETGNPPSPEIFFQLMKTQNPDPYLNAIEHKWHPGSAIMLVEMFRFSRNPKVKQRIVDILKSKSGVDHADDMSQWYEWIWNQPYDPHPEYSKFKSLLYSRIDSSFEKYFTDTSDAKMRLDEIRWGGVKRDGIPPLKRPDMIKAGEADWLEDSNVVFGIIINGDARCYPKRILAWHEMFKDTIGGQSICGVY